jgi:hypothetical protein
MRIVRTALDRPYTFVVLALLIFILSPLVILRTPTDIFPNINIPVVAAFKRNLVHSCLLQLASALPVRFRRAGAPWKGSTSEAGVLLLGRPTTCPRARAIFSPL